MQQRNTNPQLFLGGLPGVPLVGGGPLPAVVIKAELTDEERALLLDAFRLIVREEVAAAFEARGVTPVYEAGEEEAREATR